MNKTIAKFKRLQNRLAGRKSDSVEVPYEIECDCGKVVTGIRRTSWIESECEACAQTVFVLPMNVYPSTKSVPSEILGGTFRERLKIVSKELIHGTKPVDEADLDAEECASKAKGKKEKEKADNVVVRPKWKLPKFTLPRIDFKRLIVRTFSPFRLLMMAVVGTAGIAGWLMISQQQVEKAQKDWLETTTQISDRLDQGNLAGILPELNLAIQAGVVLEKNDAEFRRLNNLLVETQGYEGLSSVGLIDIFHSAYNDENHLKPDAAERIKDGCSSGWFFIDAQAVPANSDGDSWLIDFPVTPGLHPVSILLPEAAISGLVQDEAERRIVFAAELDVRTAPSDNEDGQWVLVPKPHSFAILTDSAYVQAAGFDIEDDPALKQTIERQRRWIETGNTSAAE